MTIPKVGQRIKDQGEKCKESQAKFTDEEKTQPIRPLIEAERDEVTKINILGPLLGIWDARTAQEVTAV